MPNVVNLDSLRDDADEAYGPVIIPLSDGSEARLRPLVRLSKKTREDVQKSLKALQAVSDSEETTLKDVDKMVDAATKVLLAVSTNGEKLVEELDGDMALLIGVLEAWIEATQPGEAENSPTSSTSTASSSSQTSDDITVSTS